MTWSRDDAKLDRVRALMEAHELDALVVRAPDNVLYLSNYWGMKGYEAVVFPREGDLTLIAIEPSLADAERTAWTEDIRLFTGYDELDPSPPPARALALAREAAGEYERVGLELSLGTQAVDRMVGEPTTYTLAWFEAFPGATDSTPLLNDARAIKTEQEIERIRIANEIASAAMVYASDLDHDRTAETRREVVAELADRPVLAVCGHYPGGGVGRIVSRDGRVVWEPA